MTEAEFQKIVMMELSNRGHYAVKVVGASKRGVPDILCCVGGKFVAFELKSPSNKYAKISSLQEYNAKKIQSSGGEAFVLRSPIDLEVILKRMENEIR